jgi:hypothetical protein
MARWQSCILAAALTLPVSRADSGPSPSSASRAPTTSAHAVTEHGQTATAPDTLVLEREAVGPSSDRACQARIAAALAQPGLPGAPELEAQKGSLLLYAKAEPVHFSHRPTAATNLARSAQRYRSMLERTHSPWSMLQRLSSLFASDAELARAVLLSDGYLYAEEPKLAFALVDLVSAQLLFNAQQLWIQRGDRLLWASRSQTGHYVFRDGPEAGQRVRLMLFDRIGVDEPPAPLHRDFRELRQRLGFERARVVHETETELVAELRYGPHWVRSLLEAKGAHLELGCELSAAHAATLDAHRARHGELMRVLEPLRAAMRAQVDEGLPFDEPITEYGQQDGQLRSYWQQAYLAGRGAFEFQDDIYYVFDARGRPRVPQVCIDFIFDTFERASGGWWRPRGQPPAKTRGALELAAVTSLNLRRANSLMDLARAQPAWLELHTIEERERVPFKYGPRLAEYLTEHADDFMPGDVVVIRGYAPWDKPWMPRIMHMHSFFVYESDPMTGMPIVLAGNPGRPVLQTWQFEAFRTPERSIHYRVRPRLEWLRQFIASPAALPPPVPLTVDPRESAPPLDVPVPPTSPSP